MRKFSGESIISVDNYKYSGKDLHSRFDSVVLPP